MVSRPILVVDDEPDMRTALTHALNRTGYAVETASNGYEALDKFNREKFGMVIADIKMPEMSGIEVLERVKKMSPEVPVIMITAYGSIGNAVEAMKVGASDYILKPFSFEVLEAAVKRIYNMPGPKLDNSIKDDFKLNKQDSRSIISQNKEMLKILDVAKSIAKSNATILILGESGTGKELIANYIHKHSNERNRSYVAVNCAALPESLAESELFGHEKGSFTGAFTRKIGKFELANHGTIILDEISEMPLSLQAKLLRVLQEREIDRIGGNRSMPLDVRIIAISNIDLKLAVKKGKFREDLFYRINVIPIKIPPLRERKDDLSLLAGYFLKKVSSKNNRPMESIAKETISLLSMYDWKGNVRELENTIERAVLLGDGEVLLPKHLFLEETAEINNDMIPFKVGLSLKEMEKKLIFQTLKDVNGNRTRAVEILGISIRTLRNKLNEYKEEK